MNPLGIVATAPMAAIGQSLELSRPDGIVTVSADTGSEGGQVAIDMV